MYKLFIPLRCLSVAVWLVGMLLPALGAQDVDLIRLEEHVIRISYWKKNTGLPSWRIREVVNDQRGLVWLATDKGLVSLTGNEFILHTLDIDATEQQNIQRIVIDARQNLWLLCRERGKNGVTSLYIYDPYRQQTKTFAAYTGSTTVFDKPDEVTLYEAEGRIWLFDRATGKGGYYERDLYWHEVLDVGCEKAAIFKRLYYPANSGHFWRVDFGSNKIALIDARGALQEEYTWQPQGSFPFPARPGLEGELYLLGVEQTAADTNTVILSCAPGQGLTRKRKEDMIQHPWAKVERGWNHVGWPIWEKNNQGISLDWQKADDLDIKVYADNKLVFTNLHEYLQQKTSTQLEFRIFVLDDGSFWLIGTDALIRIEVVNNPFQSWFQDMHSPPSTRGIATLNERLYVNSYSGFFEINTHTGKTTKIFHLPQNDLLLQDNLLWSSYQGGLFTAYNLDNRVIDSFFVDTRGQETRQFHLSTSGRLYASSAKGLFYVLPGTKQFIPIGIEGETFGLYENRSGLWVGGDGLRLLDSMHCVIRDFSDVLSYQGVRPFIKAIHEDQSGIFWMATEQGLWRWRPFTNDLRVFAGFASDNLHGVFEDKQERLWIPSDDGLLLYDKHSNLFSVFTTQDGLPSDEFNKLSTHRSESGHLYLGGISGLVSFHPDSIHKQNAAYLPVQLLSLVIKDLDSGQHNNLTYEAVHDKKEVFVPAGTDEINIHFFAPVFKKEHIRYYWRLLTTDTTWNELSEPVLSLYRLPFGRHTLQLAAARSRNELSQTPSLEFHLQVEPPIYLRTSFITFTLVLFFSLMALFVRLRQRQLRQRNQQLAQEVAQKTIQLQQERDVIARQAAELRQLDQEKSHFFQDLSHEIRNPLSLIVGPANDMLKDESLSEKQKNRLERIRRNAQKILQLIEELLELTKLEAGVVSVETQLFEPAALVEHICQDFKVLARQKGIEWRLKQHLPATAVRGDKRKLEKILTNLLQNALKFTPTGGTVTVETGCSDQQELLFTVRDTGTGIAPENLERIFDRYYQAYNGRQTQGFGIGLAMCRNYAQLMGGDITVTSELGRGSTFYVRIPYTQAAVKFPSHATVEATKVLSAPPSDKTPCILLVDDDTEVRAYVAGQLSAVYHVLEAEEGEQAAALIQQQKVDLVISDIDMPDLDGLELLARLRNGAGATARMPFMFLTGSTSREQMLQARQLGAAAYLTKPVAEQELLDTVRRILEQAHMVPGSEM